MSTAPLIIGIGEILWDLLPAGRQLGGAPANFAYHASALGAHGAVVSRVGDDELGREILQRLDSVGLDRTGISIDAEHPTGVVNVTLDASGVPSYEIKQDVAWDFLPCDAEVLSLASRSDAVCFGTLGQRNRSSRAAIRSFLDAAPKKCLRVFDINLRQHYYSRELVVEMLKLVDVLKLNDQELPIVAQLLEIHASGIRETLAEIQRRFPLQIIALTRGPGGSILRHRDGQFDDHPGEAAQIADTVGAGDAFTAALVLGLLKGLPLQQINTHANKLAAYVCSQHGAMPAIPRSMRFANF